MACARGSLARSLVLLTLHVQKVETPEDDTDGRRSTDYDEGNGPQPTESEKGRKVIGIESPEATDGEPFEADTEARPKALCVAEEVFLGRSAWAVGGGGRRWC